MAQYSGAESALKFIPLLVHIKTMYIRIGKISSDPKTIQMLCRGMQKYIQAPTRFTSAYCKTREHLLYLQ